MRGRYLIVLLSALGLLLAASPLVAGVATSRPLDETVKRLAGSWEYRDDDMSIGGRIYHGWGRPNYSVVFDVRGWDWFVANVGISDRSGDVSALIVRVNGEFAGRYSVKKGQKATPVRIALTGKETLGLEMDRMLALGEPMLIRGNTPAPIGGQQPSASATGNPGYLISIDPKSIQKLAEDLRKNLSRDPGLSGTSVQLAVSSFRLVTGIPGCNLDDAVAVNVREDLSGALVNVEPPAFRLIERAQLDKVLSELKLPQTGLIDSATAQKLGKMVQAQAVLIGSISDRGPGREVVINARLINTQTGECSVAAQVSMRRYVPQEVVVEVPRSSGDESSPVGDILGSVLEDALRGKLQLSP
ncbi:MAG TPA: CsgG/HfaB family protein [Anaerolineae bacterium]|nr:CsgG/HfaB family protein [Anaerolineae bacterium]